MNEIIENDCREILSRVDLRKIRGKKVLVTGASGFLGQYIVSVLSLANREMGLRSSIHAVGLHKPRSLLASILKQDKNVSYWRVDLSKPFKLRGYDYIFHAAGYGQPARFIADPTSVIKVNIDATVRLLEGSPRAVFVFFSSAEVYGDIPRKLLPAREDFTGNCPLHAPRSVYAEAKRLGEALCASYERTRGMKIKIVRISHVYGPGLPSSDKRVMSEFIRKALVEKKIKLLDGGRAVRTYGYVADVVAMILFAGTNGKEMVYNVGGKDSLSVLDLAKRISKYCDVSVEIPGDSSRLAHIGRDPAIVRLDLRKIRGEMKKFPFTPFSTGLARAIEWHVQMQKYKI